LNTGEEGTTALEIDVLQKAIALRDLALAEAQLRADENAAETAVLRRILAERDNALDRVEAAARERAAALAGAYKELELLREEIAVLRRATEKEAGLTEAVKQAGMLSTRIKTALRQRAEADAALSRVQQTAELRSAALEAAQTELVALRKTLAARNDELAQSAARLEELLGGQAERDAAIRGRITLIASYRGYNLVELDDSMVALRQDLGPVDLRTEKLGDRDLAPFVLRCEAATNPADPLIRVLQQRIDDLLGS
jgi:chromosome segregation ATPase